MKTLAAFILVSSALFADELVMEDGKTIEWKCLIDKGDTYEVTPLRGDKRIVKKGEVKEIRIKKPDMTALTGATFTTDDGKMTIEKAQGKLIDLLSTIDIKKCMVPGNNGKSVADFKNGKDLEIDAAPDRYAKLEVPMAPGGEYDLTVVIERQSGNQPLYMGLSNPWAKQFILSTGGERDALLLVDKKEIVAPSNASIGGSTTLVYYMRAQGFVLTVNGKEAFSWQGDWKRLSAPSEWSRGKGGLFLGFSESKFTVHGITFTPVVPKK